MFYCYFVSTVYSSLNDFYIIDFMLFFTLHSMLHVRLSCVLTYLPTYLLTYSLISVVIVYLVINTWPSIQSWNAVWTPVTWISW